MAFSKKQWLPSTSLLLQQRHSLACSKSSSLLVLLLTFLFRNCVHLYMSHVDSLELNSIWVWLGFFVAITLVESSKRSLFEWDLVKSQTWSANGSVRHFLELVIFSNLSSCDSNNTVVNFFGLCCWPLFVINIV